jgi:transcription-repair coupling factor (superfamily II helicase)
MAQEFADRFGPVPREVQNLLFVVGVKVRAVNAGVEAIGMEEGQLLVKCSCLETMDRVKLQERLKAQGVPGRVSRRAIWIEMREASTPGPAGAGAWQRDLVKALELMRE